MGTFNRKIALALAAVAACGTASASEDYDLRYAPGIGGADMSAPFEGGWVFQAPAYVYNGHIQNTSEIQTSLTPFGVPGGVATTTVTTRTQQISHMFVAGAEPVSLTQKVISARVIGDVAVVNGTYVMEWQGANDQQKVAEKGVFTHIFRKNSAGNWQCINSQHTVVATEDERKKKAATHTSKSNAELPLHIPLIYKGPQSTQPPAKPGTNQPPQ